MSVAKTKTVETIDGSVEYNVVECANCPNEPRAEDAVHIIAGEPDSYDDFLGTTTVKYKSGKPKQLALCEYCAESTLGVSQSWLDRQIGVCWRRLPKYDEPEVIIVLIMVGLVLLFMFAMGAMYG